MIRTAAESIDRRIYDPQTIFTSEILAVNWDTKLIQVNLGGNSGPQYIEIAASLDIGTANFPKVVQGMRALVERFYDSDSQGYGFVIRDFLTGFPNRMTAPVRVSSTAILGTPTWTSLNQAGTDLQGNFSAVPGAEGYELWGNSTSSLSTACLLLSLNSNSFALALTTSTGNVVQNSNFESGDLTGWDQTGGNTRFTVSSVANHTASGLYSTLVNFSTNDNPVIKSNLARIVSSKSYAVSAWYEVISQQVGGFFYLYVDWIKSDGATVSREDTLYFDGTVTVPVNFYEASNVLTSPSDAAYVQWRVLVTGTGGGMSSKIYFDDLTITGLIANFPATTFAIRAINPTQGLSGAFSSWISPMFQAKLMGGATASGIVTHQGYNYSACQGLQIGDLGIADTGWCYPAEKWNYFSGTVFSACGDLTNRYPADTKLRWKQGGGFLYGIVLSSSFVGSACTNITITGCTITTGSVTDNYYSYQLIPQGWVLGACGLGASTLIPNLNADLVDGYHASKSAGASQIIATDANGDWSLGTGKILSSSAIAVRVYNSTSISVPDSALTYLTFDSETFDTDGMHSTAASTNRLTPTRAGLYLVHGNIEYANNSVGDRLVAIKQSSASVLVAQTLVPAGAGFGCRLETTALLYLAAGDFVELAAYQTSGGNLNILVENNFSPYFMMVKLI